MKSVRFRERMSGYVSFDELSYNQAAQAGKLAGNECSFSIEVLIEDLDAFCNQPGHEAQVGAGVVRCPRLGGELQVEPGSTVKLFVDEPGRHHKRMLYRLFVVDRLGRKLTLSGFKDLQRQHQLVAWTDTSRLFIRMLRGRLDEDPSDASETVATGILYITRAGFARMLTTFRSPWRRGGFGSIVDFYRFFTDELIEEYLGPASATSIDDFPPPTDLDTRWQGHPPGEEHDLPGAPGLKRRILGFDADDGLPLTLHHVYGPRGPTRRPVLLAHGAATRANMFYGAPRRPSLVELLVAEGYDVWLENWRGSIDMPPLAYTLDEVAAYDHPAAVRTVLEQAGAERLKAVVHCQGSTSMTMAAIAGLVDPITTIVSNAVSLCIEQPFGSMLKNHTYLAPMALFMKGVDSQWALRSPSLSASVFVRVARTIRGRDCANPVCQVGTYMYGIGPETLWRHANLDAETHEWISREFGWCPFSLLRQIGRSQGAGHLVPVSGLDDLLPSSFVEPKVKTRARFAFLAGTRDTLFLPSGQRRSFEHFDAVDPGRHTWRELPGYSHLDQFFGRNAHRDVYPLILRELAV